MNLTLHLVRKDWRRTRPALVAWYALIAGKAWCIWQLSRLADASSNFDILGSFVNSLNGLEAVVGALLATRLVLEDPVLNPNAFWTTRPISSLQLLAAKSLAASLFFLVGPLLLLAPLWITAGFSAPEFFAAVADWALIQGVCCAVGMIAGSLAKDLNQALLVGPLAGLALLGVAVACAPGALPGWMFACFGLLVAVIGLLLIHRLRRRGLACAAVLLGGLAVAGLGGPPLEPAHQYLPAWPGPPLAWNPGELRKDGPRSWRFVSYADWGSQRFLVVQHARPSSALLPESRFTADAGRPAPLFDEEPPSQPTNFRFRPECVGTIRTASLNLTRWRFTLPPKGNTDPASSRLVAVSSLPDQP